MKIWQGEFWRDARLKTVPFGDEVVGRIEIIDEDEGTLCPLCLPGEDTNHTQSHWCVVEEVS